jgi:hypothetical protein
MKGEGHGAVLSHDEVVDHAGGDDVTGEAGMLYSAKRLPDALRQGVGGGHAGNVAGESREGQR